MLEIENGLVEQLSEIEITLAEDGGNATDNMDTFAINGGMSFPIVKVSNTVLRASDISSFVLKVGKNSPVPTLNLVFNDSTGQFRETDYINNETEIRCWLGYIESDQPPINLSMHPTDVQVKNGSVILKCELTLPIDEIDIMHDTVEQMLTDFADKTKLGIKCNFDDVLAAELIRNFVHIKPVDFIQQFCEHTGMPWFIDTQYNVRMLDIDASIAAHETKQCDIQFFSSDKPKEAYEVKYTNDVDKVTQFKFTTFGYDFIDVDNTVPQLEAVTFDKSFAPDIELDQTIEEDFTAFPPKPDTDCLYFEAQFDPYKLVGETFEIEVLTQTGRAKRVPMEQYEEGYKADQRQQLIEDVSGIYLLTNIIYNFISGKLSAWTSFERVSEQQVE